MLDKLKMCVEAGEKLGADFVEARSDDLTLRTLQRSDDTWKDIQVMSRLGVAITCYVDGVSGFSFSASTEKEAILGATEKSFKMAKASAAKASLKLPFERRDPVNSRPSDTYAVKIHPRDRDLSYKTDLVNRAVETAREFGENIRNVRGLYGELYGPKVFTNSDGSVIDWEFLVTDLRCSVTAMTQSGAMVQGYEGVGGTHGLEFFESGETTPEAIGEAAGRRAKEQLAAKACPAGKFKSLVENRLVNLRNLFNIAPMEVVVHNLVELEVTEHL